MKKVKILLDLIKTNLTAQIVAGVVVAALLGTTVGAITIKNNKKNTINKENGAFVLSESQNEENIESIKSEKVEGKEEAINEAEEILKEKGVDLSSVEIKKNNETGQIEIIDKKTGEVKKDIIIAKEIPKNPTTPTTPTTPTKEIPKNPTTPTTPPKEVPKEPTTPPKEVPKEPTTPPIINDKIVNPPAGVGTIYTPLFDRAASSEIQSKNQLTYGGSIVKTMDETLNIFGRQQISSDKIKSLYIGKTIDSKYKISNVYTHTVELNVKGSRDDGSVIDKKFYEATINSGIFNNKFSGIKYDKTEIFSCNPEGKPNTIKYFASRLVIVMNPIE